MGDNALSFLKSPLGSDIATQPYTRQLPVLARESIVLGYA